MKTRIWQISLLKLKTDSDWKEGISKKQILISKLDLASNILLLGTFSQSLSIRFGQQNWFSVSKTGFLISKYWFWSANIYFPVSKANLWSANCILVSKLTFGPQVGQQIFALVHVFGQQKANLWSANIVFGQQPYLLRFLVSKNLLVHDVFGQQTQFFGQQTVFWSAIFCCSVLFPVQQNTEQKCTGFPWGFH